MHNQFPLLEESFIIPLSCSTEIPAMISISIIFPAFNGPIILSMSDIFSFISCFVILNYFCARGSRFISKCFHSPFSYQGGRGSDRNYTYTWWVSHKKPQKKKERKKGKTTFVQYMQYGRLEDLSS